MMDLDNYKKAWQEANRNQSPTYSMEEIDQFRKSRSRDFSKWMRSSLRTDFIMKGIFSLSFIVLFFLFSGQSQVQIICLSLAVFSALLILLERPHYVKSIQLDQNTEALQIALETKLKFLKSYYFRIQFLVGLTNPLLVTVGSFFYYYFKYREFPSQDLEDILVFTAILIISFLFTIPTTASLYGFHLKTLKNSLANLENSEHWDKELKRYKKSKKILMIVFLGLLFIGIVALVLILFRYKAQQ